MNLLGGIEIDVTLADGFSFKNKKLPPWSDSISRPTTPLDHAAPGQGS
jgi:hypothetical protein